MLASSLLEDIDYIYQAAIDPGLYPQLANRLAERFKSTSTNIVSNDRLTGQLNIAISTGVSLADQNHYMQHYHADDALIKIPLSLKSGVAYTNNQVIEERTYRSLRSYQEFYCDQGIHHWLGANIVNDDKEQFIISFTRPETDPDFDNADKAYYQQLLPHLKNAQLIHQHFRVAQQNQTGLFAYLHQSVQPMIALNLNMRLIEMNDAAIGLLNQKLVRIKNGHVLLTDYAAQKQLFHLLQLLYQSNPLHANQHAITYGPYTIKLMLLHVNDQGELSAGHKRVVLVFEETETQSQKVNRLSKQYALTSKEKQVVIHLLAGLSINQIAEKLHVTAGAVRFHLKNLFSKTQTHTQKALLLRFMRS